MAAETVAADPVVVIQSVGSWLPITQYWLYEQVRALPPDVRNVVVCEDRRNRDAFPFEPLHSFAETSSVRHVADRILRKLGRRGHDSFVAAVARRRSARVLHSHFGHVGWRDRRVASALGLRHVVTFYGYDLCRLPVAQPEWRARYKAMFAGVDLVLCEGSHMRSTALALGCPEDRAQVQHIGVPVESIPFEPRAWRADEPLKVFIAAAFREKKGIPYALRALGRLRQTVPVEVTIVGGPTGEPQDEAERRQIESAIGESDLVGCTRLLGFQPHDVLTAEGRGHHVFLSPSVTARDGDAEGGAPITIIEMAATGMPVVTTRHCDIPEVIPDARLLSEERDVEGLAARLEWLVANRGQWATIGESLRKHIAAEYDSKIQGRRLAARYRELAGS